MLDEDVRSQGEISGQGEGVRKTGIADVLYGQPTYILFTLDFA